MTKKTNINNIKEVIKIKSLDTLSLDKIQIDKSELLEPQKDMLCKFVITAQDTDFCDSETILEYQANEHEERKQILVFKSRFLGYMIDNELKAKSKDMYIIDIGTKRPNYAKSLLALKITKEHYNINGQLFPVIELIPNYIQYNESILNTYMITPSNDNK